MANGRIKDLLDTVISTELQALLDTLYLAVDETSFEVEQKIALGSWLTSVAVINAGNNYQAMTPKSFYDSLMYTNRYGVGELATDNEIRWGNGTVVIAASKQDLMQALFQRRVFVSNGAHDYPYSNAEGVSMKSLELPVTFETYLQANNKYSFTFTRFILPTGRIYKKLWVRYAVASPNSVIVESGAMPLEYKGTEVLQQIKTTGMYLGIAAGGRDLLFKAGSVTGYYRLSATYNIVLD